MPSTNNGRKLIQEQYKKGRQPRARSQRHNRCLSSECISISCTSSSNQRFTIPFAVSNAPLESLPWHARPCKKESIYPPQRHKSSNVPMSAHSCVLRGFSFATRCCSTSHNQNYWWRVALNPLIKQSPAASSRFEVVPSTDSASFLHYLYIVSFVWPLPESARFYICTSRSLTQERRLLRRRKDSQGIQPALGRTEFHNDLKQFWKWLLIPSNHLYYWTVPLILDFSYLVGKSTSSKIADTKVSGL
jgi:hypothetical protein